MVSTKKQATESCRGAAGARLGGTIRISKHELSRPARFFTRWICVTLSRTSTWASCLLSPHSYHDEMNIIACLLVTGELTTFPIKRWPIFPPVCAQKGCLYCKCLREPVCVCVCVCVCVHVRSDGWTAWLLTPRLALLMWEVMLCRSNLHSCRLMP